MTSEPATQTTTTDQERKQTTRTSAELPGNYLRIKFGDIVINIYQTNIKHAQLFVAKRHLVAIVIKTGPKAEVW